VQLTGAEFFFIISERESADFWRFVSERNPLQKFIFFLCWIRMRRSVCLISEKFANQNESPFCEMRWPGQKQNISEQSFLSAYIQGSLGDLIQLTRQCEKTSVVMNRFRIIFIGSLIFPAIFFKLQWVDSHFFRIR
jgi:hypothetical protein